jgi:hypothetical protein
VGVSRVGRVRLCLASALRLSAFVLLGASLVPLCNNLSTYGGLDLLCAPRVGLAFWFWLRLALRGFALWRVCAIAPSFVFGWQAFSSFYLCVTSIGPTPLLAPESPLAPQTL